MAKGFKIITGTAEEVSAQATELQNNGWLLRGELQISFMPDVWDAAPRFAQVLVLKADIDEPIERSST